LGRPGTRHDALASPRCDSRRFRVGSAARALPYRQVAVGHDTRRALLARGRTAAPNRTSEEHHDAIIGHANGSVGRSYGRGVPLKVLAESMAKVSYPGLKLA